MKPVLGIVDLEVGNIASVARAVTDLGSVAVRVDSPTSMPALSALILPGVGSFGAAVAALDARNLRMQVLQSVENGVPLLGICLGMQLLLDCSEESPEATGLGLIPGRVLALGDMGPRIGWSKLSVKSALLNDSAQDLAVLAGEFLYFNHNYMAVPNDASNVRLVSEGEPSVPALIEQGNVLGVQFHPERSQFAGRSFLAWWLRAKVYDGLA